MKKFKALSLLLVLALVLVACGNGSDDNTTDETNGDDLIAVNSREEGSGARGAFEELVDVNTEEGVNDMTAAAIIRDGNGVVANAVMDSSAAIGYISFATFISQGDALRGLYIGGVAPTTENMLAGDYALVRPFNFVYMEENLGDIERAFIEFATSVEGLTILEDMGAVVDFDGAANFDVAAHGNLTGTSSFGGSTSTEATASALIEEFRAWFPQVEITYDSTGSGAGITGAREGTFTIGFASREILESELEGGLNVVMYCKDGIVIVVNPANDVTDLTIDQLRDIWMGVITTWSEVR